MIYLLAPYKVDGIEQGTLDGCLSFIRDSHLLGIDTETDGLDPHVNKVLMLQIGDEKTQYVIDTRFVDPTPIFKVIDETDPLTLVGANLKFDYQMLLGNYGWRLSEIYDVQVAEKVLMCGLPVNSFSLKSLVEKYSNVQLDKDDRLEFTRIGVASFNERQVRYGALDVECLFPIRKQQMKQVYANSLINCISLEQRFVKVIAEMEYNGMYVDEAKWRELAKTNLAKMNEAESALTQWLIKNGKWKYLSQPSLFQDETTCTINWGSPKQVATIFKEEGIPVEILDEDKSREYSELLGEEVEIYKFATGKLDLEKYRENELVALFLLYKKYQKAYNTYGDEWADKFIHPKTRRVHAKFDQIKVTGRLGSYGPNIQQIPSYKSKERLSCEAHRTCFVSEEGWSLITKDFSACELRILADYSNEESMIKEFVEGTGDLHSLTASKVFKVPVNSDENKHLRQIGKTLNFAIIKIA